MPSEQVENYLKNIFKLQEEGGKVTTSSLSTRLQVSAASVSEMIRKLAEEGSVRHTPYKGVELTEEGRKKALRIIRRHRLWELFLVEVLKYDWDQIDEEAERLEHITSERLERRIDEILGYPDRDPHGHVIPTAEGSLDDRQHPELATVKVGATVGVVRVSDESPELLQYLSKLGITLGTRLRVIERIEFDGSLRVEIGDSEQFISPKLAENIFVELLETSQKEN
ncbi:MAG TPA: metal-dependent transcriptional regulator [Bacteroidota bacterium]|nr:metal-dependent transcriptional regulator [Bacteroidota bacterium]